MELFANSCRGGFRHRGINIENLKRQEFFAGVAEVAAALVIHIQETQCFRVDYLNRIVGLVDQFSKQPQRIFGALPFRNVHCHAQHALGFTPGSVIELTAGSDPARGPVKPDNAELRRIGFPALPGIGNRLGFRMAVFRVYIAKKIVHPPDKRIRRHAKHGLQVPEPQKAVRS